MQDSRDKAVDDARKVFQDRLRRALADADYKTLQAVRYALIERKRIETKLSQTIKRVYSGKMSTSKTDPTWRIVQAMAELTKPPADVIAWVEEYWAFAAASGAEADVPSSGELERRRWHQVILRQEGRRFASVDVVDIDPQRGDQLVGRIARVSPPAEQHLRWEFVGTTFAGEAIFICFWPTGEDPDRRSRGTIWLTRRGPRGREHYEGEYTRLSEDDRKILKRSIEWNPEGVIPQEAFHRIALLDFDNTLHRGWSLRPWLEFLAAKGWSGASEAGKKMDGFVTQYESGRFDHDALSVKCAQLYSSLLRGRHVEEVEALAKQHTRRSRNHIEPFALPLVEQLLEMGVAPFILSGAPEEVLKHHADFLGVAYYQALTNEADDDGVYTGIVLDNPTPADYKEEFIARVVNGQGREVVLAAGDEVSDFPSFDAAPVRIIVGDLKEQEHWPPDTTLRISSASLDDKKTPEKVRSWIGANVQRGDYWK